MLPPHGLGSLNPDDTALGRRRVRSMLFSINIGGGSRLIIVVGIAGLDMALRRRRYNLRGRVWCTDADSIFEQRQNRGSH